jgi:hypothetical protein
MRKKSMAACLRGVKIEEKNEGPAVRRSEGVNER